MGNEGSMTSRRRGFAWSTVLLLVAVVIAIVGGAYYGTFYVLGTNSRFCTSCHNMVPYYEQWATSTHRQVECVECHPINPGFVTTTTVRYWLGAYNPRPRAEVRDESCLASGCHERRLLEGKVRYKEGVVFDHAAHLGQPRRGERLHCSSCHSQIAQGEHMAVDEGTCFLCHFKGAGKGNAFTACNACHQEPATVTLADGYSFNHAAYLQLGVECAQCHAETATGTGDVPQERCYSCHVERLERYADVDLIHDVHVTGHFVDCGQCHEPIRHGKGEMVSSLRDTCDSCHGGPHSPQREVYMGASGRGVTDTPSRMFAAQVSCRGCHVEGSGDVVIGASPAEAWEAKRHLCVACHGPGYDGMLDDWKRVSDRAILAVAPAAESARAALASTPPGEARQLLDDAVHNYDLARNGRAAHNVEYAVKLLTATATQVQTANAMLGGSLVSVDPSALLGPGANTCTLLCHERLGVPDSLVMSDLGVEFPHRQHFGAMGLPCVSCHPANRHKQGGYEKAGCVGCHHMSATTTDTCGRCHVAAAQVYAGEVTAVPDATPDPMEKVVNCLGCHDLRASEAQATVVRAKCVMCHGEAYGATLDGWKSSYDAALKGLRARHEAAADRASVRGAGADSAALDEARALIELLDRSGYAHNPGLVKTLTETANRALETVEAGSAP